MTRLPDRRSPGTSTRKRPPVRAGRGIAMMLVLVALVVTTILVGASLTSRENSPAIGNNAADAAEATWSAESAVNFAVGAIEQSADLGALLGGDDTLTNAMTIGGADVAVTVTNINGDPATEADRHLIVRAEASVAGVRKVVEKQVTRLGGGDLTDVADPYLSEFAVFALERTEIRDGAKVGIWALSPEAASGVALAKIGVGFANSSEFDVDPDATLRRVGIYADADASMGLETVMQSIPADVRWTIPIDVPTLPVGIPIAFSSLTDHGTYLEFDAVNSSLADGGRYGGVEVRNNGKLTIDGSTTPRCHFAYLAVEGDSALVIRGNVEILLDEDLRVDGSSIVLEPDASLTIYVTRDVTLNNASKVGILAADVASGDGVVSSYVRPTRCRILAVAPSHGGTTGSQWTLDNGAVAVASLHNPLGRVRAQNNATICGHVVAGEFRLDNGCSLLFCPTLDTHIGYSSPHAPIYDANGDPIPEFVTILADAASLGTAEGFANKVFFEYDALVSLGTLDIYEIDGNDKTVTQTINMGGVAVY